MTKRALALVLALSMVFGLTVTVYAEEENGASDNVVIAEVEAVEAVEETASTEAPEGVVPTVSFSSISFSVHAL